jgi:hypothetical protein
LKQRGCPHKHTPINSLASLHLFVLNHVNLHKITTDIELSKAQLFARMKKTKLLIDYDFDFELIGITTVVKGYKLAWEINQLLHINLVKQPDLVVGFKNNEEKTFSFYAYESVHNRLKLFKNRNSENEAGKYFLIPEFPHFDFIILAAMEEQYAHQQLIQLLKQVPAVQLVSAIPLEGLKSKSNFIF